MIEQSPLLLPQLRKQHNVQASEQLKTIEKPLVKAAEQARFQSQP
jgi:hypothetical protein